MKAGNLSLVKNMNNALVWNYLAEKGGVSITDIAKSVGLSFPTVNRALESGLEKGIIAQGEISNSSVGRKPQIYELNKNFSNILCIEVNEEIINYEIKDFCGKTFADGACKCVRKNIIDDLVEIINSCIKTYGKIDLAAISMTGVVSGSTVVSSYLYPSLDGINICDTLFLITGVRTIIENNMRILGYTANALIEDKDDKTVGVLMFSKEGIGSCNIIRGQIQSGNGGFAGEVGYIPFDERNIKKPDIYAKITAAVVSVLAPHDLIIYNEIENISNEDVMVIVKKYLPEYAIPQIISDRDCYKDSMNGIYLMSRGYLMALAAKEK